MKTSSEVVMLFLVCAFLWRGGTEARKDNLPRLAEATLLVGYPPYSLILTTPNGISKLQQEGHHWLLAPSMSRDGRIIASARIPPSEVSRGRPNMVIATYSVADKKWTEYKDLEIVGGAVAISPDGTRLACLLRERRGAPSHLHVLDLGTGQVTVGPKLWEYDGTNMSWSPDGRRIVFEMDLNPLANKQDPTLQRAIHILDLETGKISKISDGRSPSWSPSGEWIAFLDSSEDDPKLGSSGPSTNRVRLIRPDGTDSKVLVTFHRDEILKVAPVWSPDSKTLLLNRFRDEPKATMDIYLLDIGTLKLTRKFKDTPPVYAWVEAK